MRWSHSPQSANAYRLSFVVKFLSFFVHEMGRSSVDTHSNDAFRPTTAYLSKFSNSIKLIAINLIQVIFNEISYNMNIIHVQTTTSVN